MTRGCLVTVEGIEGVGKSTNLAFIAERIRAAGKDLLLTREPGGVPLAERIRELLLSTRTGPVSPMTELLLIFAARSAHLDELIRPSLQAGSWVLCDRFTDASFAYQGGGRGLPAAAVSALEELVQGALRPDLTLLLDASWEATMSRRRERGGDDRFEIQGQAFFERVRASYLEIARREPERVKVIDAARTLSEVQAQIAVAVDSFIQIHI
jgi:dTMP kinase